MLKQLLTQKKYFKNIYKAQHGITGLETAIILIAFVVVAAVFAYTVLSAGLFSTQKSQEAVYNGLQETQNTLEVKGAVLAESIKFKDACDDATVMSATGDAGATLAGETSVIHEGDGSYLITGNAANVVNETVAVSDAVIPTTIHTGDTFTFWAKLGTATADQVGFAVATAAGSVDGTAATKVLINATDTNWHQYSVNVDAAQDAASVYYGFYCNDAALDAGTLYIDDIEMNNASEWLSTSAWTPYATSLILVLSLPSGGQAVDFTPGTDTNSDGLFNDAGKTNKIVCNFNDAYQHYSDVAWTQSFIGNTNGDNMLDPGEKVKIVLDLSYINNQAATTAAKIGVNHTFTIELKAPKGAILSLQRTMPARLYGTNNLN
jgi:flagellin-like protein